MEYQNNYQAQPNYGVQPQVPQVQYGVAPQNGVVVQPASNVNYGQALPDNGQVLMTGVPQNVVNSAIVNAKTKTAQKYEAEIAGYKAQLAQYEQLQQAYVNSQAELTKYKTDAVLLNSGVSSEFADYVAFKANQLVTNEKSLEVAVAEVLQANPQFINPQFVAQPQGSPVPNNTVQTGINNGMQQVQSPVAPNAQQVVPNTQAVPQGFVNSQMGYTQQVQAQAQNSPTPANNGVLNYVQPAQQQRVATGINPTAFQQPNQANQDQGGISAFLASKGLKE